MKNGVNLAPFYVIEGIENGEQMRTVILAVADSQEAAFEFASELSRYFPDKFCDFSIVQGGGILELDTGAPATHEAPVSPIN